MKHMPRQQQSQKYGKIYNLIFLSPTFWTRPTPRACEVNEERVTLNRWTYGPSYLFHYHDPNLKLLYFISRWQEFQTDGQTNFKTLSGFLFWGVHKCLLSSNHICRCFQVFFIYYTNIFCHVFFIHYRYSLQHQPFLSVSLFWRGPRYSLYSNPWLPSMFSGFCRKIGSRNYHMVTIETDISGWWGMILKIQQMSIVKQGL